MIESIQQTSLLVLVLILLTSCFADIEYGKCKVQTRFAIALLFCGSVDTLVITTLIRIWS